MSVPVHHAKIMADVMITVTTTVVDVQDTREANVKLVSEFIIKLNAQL